MPKIRVEVPCDGVARDGLPCVRQKEHSVKTPCQSAPQREVHRAAMRARDRARAPGVAAARASEWRARHPERSRAQNENRRGAAACTNCGRLFLAYDPTRVRFCSNACWGAWQGAAAAERRAELYGRCVCGTPLTASSQIRGKCAWCCAEERRSARAEREGRRAERQQRRVSRGSTNLRRALRRDDPEMTVERLYGAQGGLCGICLEHVRLEPGHYHLDHVWPRFLGGADVWPNIAVAHPRCNDVKGGLRRAATRGELLFRAYVEAILQDDAKMHSTVGEALASLPRAA